jgi:competence protein ComFC
MLLDFLFPRRCLGCGQFGSYFCPNCLADTKLETIGFQICPSCRQPSIYGMTHLKCRSKYSLDGLITLFSYQGLVAKAIKKLKYYHLTDLAGELIGLATSFIEKNPENNFTFLKGKRKEMLLIPVPLHPLKERRRGFNQAAILGEVLVNELGGRYRAGFLVRRRYTKPQTKLKGEERKKNIKGAFRVRQGASSQINQSRSCIFIFDDVWTTGSTLRECGRAIKKAGVKNVWGLTLAR